MDNKINPRISKNEINKPTLNTTQIPNKIFGKILSYLGNMKDKISLLSVNTDIVSKQSDIMREYMNRDNFNARMAKFEISEIVRCYENLEMKGKIKEILTLKEYTCTLTGSRIFMDAFIDGFGMHTSDSGTGNSLDILWNLIADNPHLAYSKCEIFTRIGNLIKDKDLKYGSYSYEVTLPLSQKNNYLQSYSEPKPRKWMEILISAALNNLIDEKNNLNFEEAKSLYEFVHYGKSNSAFHHKDALKLLAEIYLLYKARNDSDNAKKYLSHIDESLQDSHREDIPLSFIAGLYNEQDKYDSLSTQNYTMEGNHYFFIAQDAVEQLERLYKDSVGNKEARAQITKAYTSTVTSYVTHCIKMGKLEEANKYLSKDVLDKKTYQQLLKAYIDACNHFDRQDLLPEVKKDQKKTCNIQ